MVTNIDELICRVLQMLAAELQPDSERLDRIKQKVFSKETGAGTSGQE